MAGKVSLIIPIYNRKNDLVECLDSVFLLDYKNLEVIVSDDCSPVNSTARKG